MKPCAPLQRIGGTGKFRRRTSYKNSNNRQGFNMSVDNSRSLAKTYLMAAIPLVLFMTLAFIFYKQLSSGISSSTLPSMLIDKPAPAFPSEPLIGLEENGTQLPPITKELIAGKVTLVNVWASWCAPCRVEHPVISKLAEDNKDILLVGINYKDKNPNALRFLRHAAVSIDPKGSASIDWGVYGIPETFIVDKTGTIIYRHVGPINPSIVEERLMPIINDALRK